jgi:hypothetical protein
MVQILLVNHHQPMKTKQPTPTNNMQLPLTPDQIRRVTLGLDIEPRNFNRRRHSALRVALWQAATIAAICWAFVATLLFALIFWATV